MLRKLVKKPFSLINTPGLSRPVQERVMSTPSWPVPYYKRLMRCYPAENPRKLNIEVNSGEITDEDVINLKFKMELNPEKREIMLAYENNIQTDCKIIMFFIYLFFIINLIISFNCCL